MLIYELIVPLSQVTYLIFLGGRQVTHIKTVSRMIQEFDQASNIQRRNLGQEQDLQLVMDHDLDEEERDLKTKIIFAVQGLGSVQEVGRGLKAYIKGQHCEQSIKDLVKLIRRDSPLNPKVKLHLADFNIFESDLINLLLLQVEDKKLSFWLIALMAMLTGAPPEELQSTQKKRLQTAARNYKKSMLRRQTLNTLSMHIAQYFKTEPENRLKAHIQMVQFIIMLLRNILQVPNEPDENSSLHQHFLVLMIKEQMFEPLLYLIQTEKGELVERISVPLLQIFYHTFTCFDHELIYPKKNTSNFMIQSMKFNSKNNLPARHSRFMPNFLVKTNEGVTKVMHKISKGQEEPNFKQRKVPNKLADLKKVQKIGHQFLGQNFMELEYQFNVDGESVSKKIGTVIFQLAKQFLEVEFAMLSQLVFNSIYKQTSNVTDQHVINYMLLCSWALQMTRKKYHYAYQLASTPQQKGMVEFDLTYIACVMQTAHFQLIYKLLFRETTRDKKKDFKVNVFHSALQLFLSYLEVIEDISRSMNMSDRKNANTLMANVFRHDLARILKLGFSLINHQQILGLLITVLHRFFKLLSVYSKGKVLTIKTDKLLKRKKNKRSKQDEDQLEDFIEKDSNSDENDDSYKQEKSGQEQQKQEKKKKKQKKKVVDIDEDDEPQFIERKFNEISQFAIVAEYGIISKYLIFLKHKRFLKNTESFNESLLFYFQRIVSLLKGEWLFFQAETLSIIQQILSEEQFCLKNRPWTKIFRGISFAFIKLLKKNRLALIESLFRYPSLQVKESVLKNYQSKENSDSDGEPQQGNLFID